MTKYRKGDKVTATITGTVVEVRTNESVVIREEKTARGVLLQSDIYATTLDMRPIQVGDLVTVKGWTSKYKVLLVHEEWVCVQIHEAPTGGMYTRDPFCVPLRDFTFLEASEE